MSGYLQSGANSVSQVDGVSDMVPECWLCGSVGDRLRRDNGICLPFYLGESCPPSSHFDATHFSFSLYATSDFQAATPVLELKGSESE